jgi:HK97 family phage prohead protease
MKKETRIAEVRFLENEEMILEGYAIVFNQETLIGDEARGFYEQIDPSALSEASMKDVPLKYNHMDSHLILARTKNASLELKADEFGLKVRAKLLDTASNKDIYKMVRSGLLDKMSFAFNVEGETWDFDSQVPKRKVTKIGRLFDVSIVDTPAYEQTSIYARSFEALDDALGVVDTARSKVSMELQKKRIRIKTTL